MVQPNHSRCEEEKNWKRTIGSEKRWVTVMLTKKEARKEKFLTKNLVAQIVLSKIINILLTCPSVIKINFLSSLKLYRKSLSNIIQQLKEIQED
jgi:hypothetical protein